MKNIDIKFATSQAFLIIGLVLFSVDVFWSLFIGLVFFIASAVLSLRFTRPRSIFTGIIRILCGIAITAFFLWYPIGGDRKLPVAALVAVWLGVSIDEFRVWRKTRSLT